VTSFFFFSIHPILLSPLSLSPVDGKGPAAAAAAAHPHPPRPHLAHSPLRSHLTRVTSEVPVKQVKTPPPHHRLQPLPPSPAPVLHGCGVASKRSSG
jgi:hypothetical protein